MLPVEIPKLVLMEGRGNCNDEGVCLFRLGGNLEVARSERSLDGIAQARFMDVDLSASQSVNDVRVHIYAENFDAVRSEGGCGGQADIAQT